MLNELLYSAINKIRSNNNHRCKPVLLHPPAAFVKSTLLCCAVERFRDKNTVDTSGFLLAISFKLSLCLTDDLILIFLSVNCLHSWVCSYALPNVLATRLHSRSAPTSLGLLLVRLYIT